MRYRQLGRQGRPGLRVSEIGLGTREIGGTVWIDDGRGSRRPHGFGAANDGESLRMLARAKNLGINFIMCSPSHGAGHAEDVVGKAIAGHRDHWVLGVMGGVRVAGGKIGRDFGYEALSAGLDESTKRLGTAEVDMFLLQGPTWDEIEQSDCIEALDRFRASGRAGLVGVEVAGDATDVDALLPLGLDVVGVRYNLFEPQAADAFASAREVGVGVIADGVLVEGFLAGKISGPGDFGADDERGLLAQKDVEALTKKASTLSFLKTDGRSLAQAALLYVLANQAVGVALTGASTVQQLEEDAAAGTMPRLDEETLTRIGRLQRSGFSE